MGKSSKTKRISRETALSISVIAMAAALVGCRGEQESSDGVYVSDSQTDVVESAVTMIQGQADDAAGSTFAMQTKSPTWKYAVAESLLFDRASANNCGRAVAQACNTSTGVREITYTNCVIAARGFTLTGSVNLEFSNNNCTLGIGENVVRTYDHTISGPRGGSIRTTSETRSEYDGTQVGGGGKLTRVGAASWDIELLGKHKIGTVRNRTVFDVSARTTTPLAVSVALDRNGRTVSSGAVEISHNLAKFKATLEVAPGQPLVWSSSCCHPVSGRLNATYQGSISGSGSVTFNGCGSAELSKDGSTRTLSLGYCE